MNIIRLNISSPRVPLVYTNMTVKYQPTFIVYLRDKRMQLRLATHEDSMIFERGLSLTSTRWPTAHGPWNDVIGKCHKSRAQYVYPHKHVQQCPRSSFPSNVQAMSVVQATPSAAVRVATREDVEAATTVLTRAYLNDPALNWFGCVKNQDAANDIDSPVPGVQQTIKNLRNFQRCLVTVAMLVGGVVTLAVVPSQGDGKGEKIVGVSVWLQPGQTFDVPLGKLLKAGAWSVLKGWGVRGLKHIFLDFTPSVEKALLKAFKARNMNRLDSWHLLAIVVDPDWQGKGVSSLLMRDSFSRAKPKPIHLEASSTKSRDIYAHFGFEINNEHIFGKGRIDCRGLPAKGAEATGISEWVMTKWET